MARVILESVSKTFDSSSYAVNSLSLNVAEHSFLVLIGPSGCGKTTTLNMIAGLESISSGKIFIDEKCINDVEAKDRDIAMVFQTYALYPHLTVKDNLAFALKIRHVPKKDISAKIEKVSSLLGISQLLNRKPNQLSGGQMQRVAIGKAIMREPKVFLMDEPLSNLDASLRYKMRDELKKLHQSLNATFVYVTHDQIEAMTLGTEIAVMNEGVIQQVGSPYEVFTNPKNKFVAGFIGNPKMNFFECELKKAGDKYRFSILSIQYEFFAILPILRSPLILFGHP